MPESTMRYVAGVPRKVPEGWFVVHNHVRFPGRVGENGFRVWLQAPDVSVVLDPCGCDFATDREYTHYKIHRVPAGASQ